MADETDLDSEDPQELATRLLERALRLGQEKDDADWLHSSAVKSQMRRMDPSFSEKALGYRSFSDFVKSREAVAELDETNSRAARTAQPGHDRTVGPRGPAAGRAPPTKSGSLTALGQVSRDSPGGAGIGTGGAAWTWSWTRSAGCAPG